MLDTISVATQTVASKNSVIFNNTRVKRGCNERHEEGSGRIVLLKPGVYEITFNADVGIPTDKAVNPITVGIMQDGEVIAGSIATSSPATTAKMNHISTTILAQVYACGNSTISVINNTSDAILIQNADLVITRLC